MFDLLIRSIEDLKSSYKKYLSFALLYMLVTSFLFVPLISFIFNRMIRIVGSGALLNAEIYKIGLSTTGFFSMLLISFLAVVLLLVEFGVMITIAEQNYFRRSIFVTDALVTTLKKFPKWVSLGFFQFIFLLIFLIPLIDLAAFPALLDFNLPIFMTDLLYGSILIFGVYILLLTMAAFMFIRLIFTLHYIFIEMKPITAAVRSSWSLTKFNNITIIFNLLILNLIIFIVSFLIVTTLTYLPLVTDIILIGDIINNYLVTFSGFLTMVFSLLLIPINVIFLTRLFYRFKENVGEVASDLLTVHSNSKLLKIEKGITEYFTKKKAYLVIGLIILVPGLFFLNDTLNDNIVYLKWNVQVAAHRGDAANAPENSLSSIRSAIEKGVDAVEFDVMLSKDGVVILHHDTTLQRVAGIPTPVHEMTYAELSGVDIGRLFSDEFIGEKIPTLDEILEEVKEEDVTLIIDLKPADRSGELAAKVVELIEKHEVEEMAYVQAFDNYSLQVVRNLNSDIKIGQILFMSAGNLADLDVDFYTIRQTMLTERFIRNARAQNREVWVWTVNIERNMREVLKYDIDGIITSYPEKLQSVIGIDFAFD